MGKGARPQTYGLIGWPVKHSYSAFMHNAAFRHYNMSAEYKLFEVEPDKLGDFFNKTIRQERIRGFNVTIPHKENVLPYLKFDNSEESYFVRQIQAVNTVKFGEGGVLFAFNTDVPGFGRHLNEEGFDPAGKKISLLGAGGGAKAVALSLVSKNAGKIFVFDAQKKKAADLAERINQSEYRKNKEAAVEVVNSIEDLKIRESDLLVNATPIGMRPEDPLLIKKEWLHRGLFVYDLIYNPAETKLLKAAKEAECSTANGSGMLLYQGVLAFKIWTGRDAPVEVMRRALKEQLLGEA